MIERIGLWVMDNPFIYYVEFGIFITLFIGLMFVSFKRFKYRKTIKTITLIFTLIIAAFIYSFTQYTSMYAWDNAEIERATVKEVKETDKEAGATNMPVYEVITEKGDEINVISSVTFDVTDGIRFKRFKTYSVVVGSKPDEEKLEEYNMSKDK